MRTQHDSIDDLPPESQLIAQKQGQRHPTGDRLQMIQRPKHNPAKRHQTCGDRDDDSLCSSKDWTSSDCDREDCDCGG